MTNEIGATTTEMPGATQSTLSPDATTLDGDHETTNEIGATTTEMPGATQSIQYSTTDAPSPTADTTTSPESRYL